MSANVSSLLYIRQHDHCPGCRWRTPYNCWPQSLGNPHGHSIHTLQDKTKDQNCRFSISSAVFTELSILWSGRNCFLLPLIKSSVLTQRIMQKIQMLVIRVRLTFTSDGCTVLQPLATYITELAFEDGGCRETMSHWILDQSCGNAGAGRHH